MGTFTMMNGDTLAEVYPVQCTTQKRNKKRGKGAEQGKWAQLQERQLDKLLTQVRQEF